MASGNSQSKVKRRKLLQKIGGTATVAGIGSTTSAGASPADPGANSGIKEVTGREAKRKIAAARSSNSFRDLRKDLKKDNVEINAAGPNVYFREDPEGVPYHVVEFPVREKRGGISVKFRQGEIQSAVASVTTEFEHEIEVDWYSTSDKGTKKETKRVAPKQELSSNGGMTTQAVGACDACEIIGDIVCSVGCGSIGVACMLANIGTIAGGLACASVVTIFCGAIAGVNEELTGSACDKDWTIKYTCMQADLC